MSALELPPLRLDRFGDWDLEPTDERGRYRLTSEARRRLAERAM